MPQVSWRAFTSFLPCVASGLPVVAIDTDLAVKPNGRGSRPPCRATPWCGWRPHVVMQRLYRISDALSRPGFGPVV